MALVRSLTTQNNEGIQSLTFSPDGQILAAGIMHGVRLWHLSDGRLLPVLKGNNPSTNMVAFSPDGTMLASCDSSRILLWRVDDSALLRSLTPANGKTEFLQGVAFSPDGQLLAAITDAATTLWRAADGTLLRTLARRAWSPNEEYSAGGGSVAFSPDGQILFTDGTGIKEWRVSDGRILSILHRNETDGPLVISPNGQTLAFWRSGGIDLLRVSDGTSLCSLNARGMIGAAESLSFSSDGNVLASSNLGYTHQDDGKIRLWRVTECRLIQTIPKTSVSSYYHLGFSPDGKLFAVGGTEFRGKASYGIIRLFRVLRN